MTSVRPDPLHFPAISEHEDGYLKDRNRKGEENDCMVPSVITDLAVSFTDHFTMLYQLLKFHDWDSNKKLGK
jgi:hypothetical protein